MAKQLALLDGYDDVNIHDITHKKKDFSNRKLVGRVLLAGMGLQTGCMIEMAIAGEIDKPDLIVFADTGDEPWWVYDYAIYITRKARKAGIRVMAVSYTSHKGNYATHIDSMKHHSLKQHVLRNDGRTNIPLYCKDPHTGKPLGMLKRQCTPDFKIQPTNRGIRGWLYEQGYANITHNGFITDEKYHNYIFGTMPAYEITSDDAPDANPYIYVNNDIYIETFFGMSMDEPGRMGERGPGWQKTRYPLNELMMTREDCITWLRERGLRIPLKSACTFCPFRSNESWLWIKRFDPDIFEEVCQFDDMLRDHEIKAGSAFKNVTSELYLHPLRVPLRDIDLEEEIRKQNNSPLFKRLGITVKGNQEHTLESELVFDTCSSDGGFSCFS